MAACFNGATPFQAWRQHIECWDWVVNVGLQWGHAFSDVEMLDYMNVQVNRRCFNGATPFQTWKLDERG